MSKYEPLWKYLESNGNQQIRLSFDEIKGIVGFDIDHSFLNYKKDAVQFGYQVGKISLKEKHVTFSKLNFGKISLKEKHVTFSKLNC